MIDTDQDNTELVVVQARFTLSLLAKALQGDQEPGLDPNITLTYDEGEGVRLLIAEVDRALGEILERACAADIQARKAEREGDSPPIQ